MHEHSAAVRVNLSVDAKSEFVSYGTLSDSAEAHVYGTLSISLDDIVKLIAGYMGYASNLSFEINIRKVSYWGPIPGIGVDVAPVLTVDLSDISGGIIVTDKCGANHRARMAVTAPFHLWRKPDANPVINIRPNVSSGLAGILDISVAWRRFAMPS